MTERRGGDDVASEVTTARVIEMGPKSEDDLVRSIRFSRFGRYYRLGAWPAPELAGLDEFWPPAYVPFTGTPPGLGNGKGALLGSGVELRAAGKRRKEGQLVKGRCMYAVDGRRRLLFEIYINVGGGIVGTRATKHV